MRLPTLITASVCMFATTAAVADTNHPDLLGTLFNLPVVTDSASASCVIGTLFPQGTLVETLQYELANAQEMKMNSSLIAALEARLDGSSQASAEPCLSVENT